MMSIREHRIYQCLVWTLFVAVLALVDVDVHGVPVVYVLLFGFASTILAYVFRMMDEDQKRVKGK